MPIRRNEAAAGRADGAAGHADGGQELPPLGILGVPPQARGRGVPVRQGHGAAGGQAGAEPGQGGAGEVLPLRDRLHPPDVRAGQACVAAAHGLHRDDPGRHRSQTRADGARRQIHQQQGRLSNLSCAAVSHSSSEQLISCR